MLLLFILSKEVNKIGSKVIEGFGPSDLIERVKEKGWVLCRPHSVYVFGGICLGGYPLINKPDELCVEKFRITLTMPETGEEFAEEGFCHSDILSSTEYEPLTFAGHQLSEDGEKGTKFFRVTIESLGLS